MSDVALGEQTYFRDDSIPWEGILLEYFSELASSDAFPADFGPTGWNFTWTSVSSRAAHSSSWTAALQAAMGHKICRCTTDNSKT